MIDRDDGPWLVLADVCAVLEIANPRDAAKRLDADEKATVANADGRAGHGAQTYNIINESGLWSLVLTSRKPEAKRFKKWLTSEVIPSIRKTGSYQTLPTEPIAQLPAPTLPNELLAMMREQTELMKAMRVHFSHSASAPVIVEQPQAVRPKTIVQRQGALGSGWKSAVDVAVLTGLLGPDAVKKVRVKAAVVAASNPSNKLFPGAKGMLRIKSFIHDRRFGC